MRLTRIDQMSEVMRVLYDREFRAIGSILAEETKIRSNLTQLEAQISRNRGACASNQMLLSVGAQLLWQGWTTRTHRQLNTELAQVMTKKLVALDRVRIAFGRQRAVEMMMSAERRAMRDRRVRRRDAHLLNLS